MTIETRGTLRGVYDTEKNKGLMLWFLRLFPAYQALYDELVLSRAELGALRDLLSQTEQQVRELRQVRAEAKAPVLRPKTWSQAKAALNQE